ncbi:hypothetical protein ABFA07_010624 [Porites harrisoni]
MIVCLGSIPCWLLASVLIAASSPQQSEALTFTERPDKPTIVVEGVNSTNVNLIWDILPGNTEVVQNLFLIRQRQGDTSQVQIASRKYLSSFTLADGFANEYSANLPATLTLLNVDNTEEYVYTLQVSYDLNNVPKRMEDSVTVIVRVPPRITEIPVRQPSATVGTNLTLTCNASGDPTPNVNWTKEGETAAEFNVSGHKLHLVNVKREDFGSYKCTADNGYGTPATSLAVVNVQCPSQCDTREVGITITDNQWPWNAVYENRASIEFKMLQSNLTSAIAVVYTRNPNKRFYEQSIRLFRQGSIVAHVQLVFQSGDSDPLQPLRDVVEDGRLGPFNVDSQLTLDPTTPPPTTPTTGTTTGTQGEPGVGARGSSGLSDAAMWGIIGACIAVVLIVVVILIVCCCVKKRKGGAGKERPMYSEADGYRMNKQPPASGLGTASPAYVEARMYAPANAPRRQDDHPPPINYPELSHDKSSNKTPPPRYSTEYSEVSTEKRQGEGGGFELWC